MKLGLHYQGQYPEPVRSELAQMVAAITTSYGVEHDAEGRQRVTCAKWSIAGNTTLADATAARVVTVRPDAANVLGAMTITTLGQVRIGAPGVYGVLGQITYDASVVGRRIAELRRNSTVVARTDVGSSGGFCSIQVSELLPCVVGDLIELFAYQSSGGPLAMFVTVLPGTYLRIVKVA